MALVSTTPSTRAESICPAGRFLTVLAEGSLILNRQSAGSVAYVVVYVVVVVTIVVVYPLVV